MIEEQLPPDELRLLKQYSESTQKTILALGVLPSEYARELTEVLGVGARLDYVLLGVGPDGHVASLFPRADARLNDRQLVAAVFDAPKPPARRLTLTMTMLCRAERLAVAAFGEAKAVVLSRVIGDPQSDLPLAEVLRCAPRPLVLADRAAAALVKAAKEG